MKMSSNDTCAEGLVNTVGGVLGSIIIILLLLLALTMTALLYPCLIRPRMSRSKRRSRIAKMLDSKIFSRLGYVSTSRATTPDPTATGAAATVHVQPTQPSPVYSTTSHVRYKETTGTSSELQPPQTEYSILGLPIQYDYVDSTVAKTYPGIAANRQHVEKEFESAVYSSVDRVYHDIGEVVYEDATQSQGRLPIAYEVPREDAKPLGPLGHKVQIGSQSQVATRLQLPHQEYSRLKHH